MLRRRALPHQVESNADLFEEEPPALMGHFETMLAGSARHRQTSSGCNVIEDERASYLGWPERQDIQLQSDTNC